MPETIIPRYKLLITYDLVPQTQEEYYQFMLGEFVPTAQTLGLYMIQAWHTAYGDYPLRMAEFVAEDLDIIEDAIQSDEWQKMEERFQSYVTDYSQKIVHFRHGFQF
jgi:hypothetical protein